MFFVLLYFSISINNKTTTDLKNQLQQKDLEIEKIKKQLEDLTQSQNSQQKEKQVEKRQIEQTLTLLDKEHLYDKDFYKKYNMGANANSNSKYSCSYFWFN